MLILTRHPGQRIKIGNDVTITLISIRDESVVSIGIEAPHEIPVHRQEIYDKIHSKETESELIE